MNKPVISISVNLNSILYNVIAENPDFNFSNANPGINNYTYELNSNKMFST